MNSLTDESLNDHGLITERSRSYHWVTHDRKGREGKGGEIGGEIPHVSGFLLCGQDQIQVTVTYPDALGLDQRR